MKKTSWRGVLLGAASALPFVASVASAQSTTAATPASAQNAPTSDIATEPQSTSVPPATDIKSADVAAAQGQPADASPETKDIVVTGSRLSNLNAPTPVTTIGAGTIATQAPVAITDVLARIPGFRPSYGAIGASRYAVTQFGVQGLPDLRGLGITRTLVLVDGQRFVGGNYQGLPDTNSIPVELVQRIDVVTGGASAAYGSDAVAGVVNIVQRNKLEGIQGRVQTGVTDYGDNGEFVASLAGGHSFMDGRVNFTAGFDYSHADGIGNGIYARPWTANEGALVPTGNQATFLTNAETANATPFGIINGPTALRGTAFDANGNPYPFAYGTLYNNNSVMVGSTANFGKPAQAQFQLANPFERIVGQGRLSADLGSDINVWVQGNYSHSSTQASVTPNQYTALIIRNDNPFLPASIRTRMAAAGVTSITLGRSLEDFGDTFSVNKIETYRFAGGISGKIFGDWAWDAYVEHGQTTQDYLFHTKYDARVREAAFAVRDANGNIVCGDPAQNPNLNATTRAQLAFGGGVTGCVPFNPFGATNNTATVGAYINGTPTAVIKYRQTAGAVNLRGSPFSLWAGPISVAVGGEFRKDYLSSAADALSTQAAYILANQANYVGRNTVVEGYGELGVPIARGDSWFLKAIDLNGAVRYTHYRVSGNVTTWKAGATYDMNDSLRFRFTRSRDIRAPTLYELFGNSAQTLTVLTNRFNGNSDFVPNVAQGNQNLTPEVAQTLTAGAVFHPTFLRGFRASVDYYDIKVDKVIVAVTPQDTVNGCFFGNLDYCSRITFGTSNASGLDLVRSLTTNLSSFKTRGLDFMAGYDHDMPFGLPGHFGITALATHTMKLELVTPPGTPGGVATTIDYAGTGGQGSVVTGVGGLPKWSGNLSLDYALGGFSATTQVTAFTSMRYDPTLFEPGDAGYATATPAQKISQNRFAGQAYVNLTLRYNVLQGDDARRFEVFTVINNLLDNDPPPFATIAFSNRTNLYNSIGRSYRVGVAFKF
ncbi:TonB-dependent receptor [Sphingomonas sp.]|uniref:TonB-dependent receptor domain-containing protein n=1 Tax=Sphingomonas sp. TaxID=28214 RepID=UPI000DB7B034|nr:TonB-dependent receptor [Sphingomonas sp.]PZU06474.1 MAG: hypothetical protein DI605_18660 [Sphingomonas sp.]